MIDPITIAQNFSRPTDSDPFYRLGDVRYIRATKILDQMSKFALYEWHSTEPAKYAAMLLIQAGLADMPKDDEKLADFIANRPWPEITPRDAIDTIVNDWRYVAKEANRYRDYKGMIGTIVHHAMYDDALGNVAGSIIDHMTGIAMQGWFVAEHWDTFERFEKLGVSTEDLAKKIAFRAKPYADSILKWQRLFQPEWEVTGKEAPVYNTLEEYAGTQDGVAILRRDVWQKATKEPWIMDDVDQETGVVTAGPDVARGRFDFKNSNTLDEKSGGRQLAAYDNCNIVYVESAGVAYENMPCDFLCLVHAKPGLPAAMKCWPKSDIPKLYASFLLLLEYWREDNDHPAPMKSRRKSAPKIDAPMKGVARSAPTF